MINVRKCAPEVLTIIYSSKNVIFAMILLVLFVEILVLLAIYVLKGIKKTNKVNVYINVLNHRLFNKVHALLVRIAKINV